MRASPAAPRGEDPDQPIGPGGRDGRYRAPAVTGGSATQSAAPERRAGWRESLTDPAVVAIALYAIVAMGAAVAAYFALFTQFAPYDDEGTLLVTLNAFAHGDTLYSDVYTPYGPFYYELFGGLLALSGESVTTDLSRSIVLVLWVGTSFLFGLAAQRLSGHLMLGVTGMIAAFGSLYALANEPMHPQVLCVLLFGAFALLAASGPTRRVAWAGAAGGALLAALTLTKLNLGVFAVAAVVLAAVLTVEPLQQRRWLRWPVIAGFLALPVLLTARDLSIGWVRDLMALELLAMAAIVIAAWTLRPQRGEDDDGTGRWLLAAAIGFAAAFVAILAAIVLNGSSLADVYDGMVTEAMRVRDVNMTEFPAPGAAVDWALAAVAAAALCVRLRPSSAGPPSIWPGLLRAAAGLTIWFAVARIAPISLNPSAGNPDALPMVLAWVAAIPPAGSAEAPFKRFVRVLLPALAVAETLQVYPVAGSQMSIAALTFVPVGALCLGDALTSLRAWSEARGGVALERFGIATGIVLVAFAAQFALDAIARPAANGAVIYRDQQALPFAGAGQLRLAPEEADTYVRLVDLLHRHRCTDFIGYPNIDSFYIWSGIDPPPPQAPGAWINALDGERQQRIVNELRASARPCAIRSDARAENWLRGAPPPDRPLARYVLDDFRPVEEVGEFQFMLPIEADSAQRAAG